MVRICCVCKKDYIAGGGRSCHRVPKSPNWRQKWCSVLQKCGILKISADTNICSDHFMNEDFYVTPAGRRKLRKGTVPSRIPACRESQSDQYPGIASTSEEVFQYPAAKRTKLGSDSSTETGSPSPKKSVPTLGASKIGCRIQAHGSSSTVTCSLSPKKPSLTLTASEVESRIEAHFSAVNRNSRDGRNEQSSRKQTKSGSDSSTETGSPSPQMSVPILGASKIECRIQAHGSSSTVTCSPSPKNSSSTLTASEVESRIETHLSAVNPNSRDGTNEQSSRKQTTIRYFGDIHSSDMESPQRAKVRWPIIKRSVKNQRMKIRRLQQKTLRMRDKIYNLETLLKHMKEKYGLSENAENMIKASLPSHCSQLFNRMLKGRTKQKYSEELRTFALTLSFYSTKAYNYVREKFNKSLPHISTITKWFKTIDGSPGFTKQSLEALKVKVIEHRSKNKNTICSLVLDEMSVMKRIQWTGNKMSGYVDTGLNIDSDEIPEASEVLVFMLVAINGHWKIPIGYFFINGLNGTEKANLVNRALEFISETGVIVSSLTFDGIPSNITMANKLGADISNPESLKTYFYHPIDNYKIYVYLDIPHMLKLVRNCLASNKHLKDADDGIISWHYFEKLVEIQESEGLKAGTKISKRHILWFKEKMKVKLAAQTFSNSVVDAFLFLKDDIKLDAFKDVQATVNFVRVFNDLFDIFNVQSLYSKNPYKQPLTLQTSNSIFSYLAKCRTYILTLTLDGNLVIKSKRKMGFLGFLIGIDSLQGIYHDYITKCIMDFVLTYKFSQDHLEIFFSAVRAKGGSSNNPTPWQFEHIYKRLLVHAEIKGSDHANVTALDYSPILTCSSVTRSKEGENMLESKDHLIFDKNLFDMDYLASPAWHLTAYCEDIVAYIAGFVVKVLKKCVICEFCHNLLECHVPLSSLQLRKAYGTLTNASRFTIDICKSAEKCLKVQLSCKKLSHPIFKSTNFLVHHAMRNLPYTVFNELDSHFSDQEHCFDLIKLVLNKYISVRLHHETSMLKSTERIRNIFTKTILFKNQ